jgi:hypothetical protein
VLEVWDLEFGFEGVEFRVQVSGLEIQRFGFTVGFRV